MDTAKNFHKLVARAPDGHQANAYKVGRAVDRLHKKRRPTRLEGRGWCHSERRGRQAAASQWE
ncbi:MAG: hypothetical protein ACREA0_09965, partial [bacterium]